MWVLDLNRRASTHQVAETHRMSDSESSGLANVFVRRHPLLRCYDGLHDVTFPATHSEGSCSFERGWRGLQGRTRFHEFLQKRLRQLPSGMAAGAIFERVYFTQ
jgi:hypothetical protein